MRGGEYPARKEGGVEKRAIRETVDLSGYPELVVIYLGMRVNVVTGLKTLLGMGPKIAAAVEAKPDGLLLHESVLYSLRHVGMRQYWRDFDALEAWARSEPHLTWWRSFLKDNGGTGFWHETYFRRGGIEAVYVDMSTPTGWGGSLRGRPRAGRCFRRASGAGWRGRRKGRRGLRRRRSMGKGEGSPA